MFDKFGSSPRSHITTGTLRSMDVFDTFGAFSLIYVWRIKGCSEIVTVGCTTALTLCFGS